MIIVTNRIKTKLGTAQNMASGFTRPSAMQQMEGFIKVEVLITQNLKEYDELNVNMYWDNIENFNSWKNSDVFKQAHKRPESDRGAEKESVILGSEIIISELASAIEASSK